jgi:hypothetical protein
MLMDRYLRRPFWPLLLVLLLCAWFFLPGSRPAQARPRHNIVLLYFTATGQNNAVLLEWATASEFETAGFLIERALSAEGPYSVLDGVGFIPSEGSGIVGAEYEATDTAASNGTTYWYRLVEVELDGDENREGPVSATPGNQQPTATYTPTPSPTPSPTASPSPTQPASSVSTPVAPGNDQNPTATQPPTQPPPTQPVNTPTTQPDPPTPLPVATVPPSATPAGSEAEETAPTQPAPTAGSLTNNDPLPTAETSQQAISQVEPTATDDSGYPGQPAATATPAEEATAYPGIPPTPLGNAPEATAYPCGAPLNESNSPGVIGGQGSPVPTEAANTGEQQGESGGTVFLWVAFIAALLIFIAGVFGSIFLFNRQRVRGK